MGDTPSLRLRALTKARSEALKLAESYPRWDAFLRPQVTPTRGEKIKDLELMSPSRSEVPPES